MARKVVKNPQLCEYRKEHTTGYRKYSNGHKRGKRLEGREKELVIASLKKDGRLCLSSDS